MVRKIEWFFLGAGLLLIAIITLDWAIKGAIHYQKDVTVPDLVSKPLNEAVDLLSQQNLGIKKDGVQFDETVPAGTILRQQPVAGSLVREGKIIRVTLSQGSETVYVPEVTGLSLRSAEISLRTNFLSLGEVQTQPSVKFEKDVVISQDPPSRKIVARNSLIRLTVSAGPPQDGTILLPDFVGKNWQEVESWAKDAGINLDRSEDTSSAAESETVVQQGLPPDSPVVKGSSVKFIVSSRKSGASSPETVKAAIFYFEVPQSESAKNYVFVLLDPSGNKEIYRGSPPPGSKLRIALPPRISSNARIRILVNGILTEERNVQ